MKHKKFALGMAAATIGVTALGAVTGESMVAVASPIMGVFALSSAMSVRRGAMMKRMDEQTMYALR